MTNASGGAVGNIRDLTDEVIARTVDSLRSQLAPPEIATLEEMVRAGTFLNAEAVLSALATAQSPEGQ
jgi:hypothetical protein